MIHRVLSTFKLVYGHLNGIFLTGNFAWAFSRPFVNSGQKDRAKYPNFDPCTVCSQMLQVSREVYLPACWATPPYYSIMCFLGHTPYYSYKESIIALLSETIMELDKDGDVQFSEDKSRPLTEKEKLELAYKMDEEEAKSKSRINDNYVKDLMVQYSRGSRGALQGDIHPLLMKLLNALKSIPPSSVEAERTFSLSGQFVTKLRTNMSDDTLPERIYNPIAAMGFSAMFTFQLDNTKR